MSVKYTPGAVCEGKQGYPAKPYKDFPLNAHPLGYWYKKVKGKAYNFGRWGHVRGGKLVYLPYEENWQAALKDFRARFDPATNTVIDEVTKAPSLKSLCNAYLAAKTSRQKAGYLTRLYVRE